MTTLGVIAALIATLILAAVCALALLTLFASRTPHGRLKPIFALGFTLSRLVARGQEGNELGTRDMGTTEGREGARKRFLDNVNALARPVPFAGQIEDRRVPAPHGDVPVRIYTPPGDGPFPIVVYMHGGGFVVGSIDYTDGVTRTLAEKTPAVVLSVEYRLAPEAPFPAAVDDCALVLAWAAEHANELRGIPRALTVAGDSAGGSLAAALALRDRASSAGLVGLQALIYPSVDLSTTDRESYRAFATGYGLSRVAVEECAELYLPEVADRTRPEASPLRADSLAGLAPALVVTAGFDVLRDEGIAYARRLEKDDVPVRHLLQPHLPHGFITLNRMCGEAEATLAEIAVEIRATAQTS